MQIYLKLIIVSLSLVRSHHRGSDRQAEPERSTEEWSVDNNIPCSILVSYRGGANKRKNSFCGIHEKKSEI